MNILSLMLLSIWAVGVIAVAFSLKLYLTLRKANLLSLKNRLFTRFIFIMGNVPIFLTAVIMKSTLMYFGGLIGGLFCYLVYEFWFSYITGLKDTDEWIISKFGKKR